MIASGVPAAAPLGSAQLSFSLLAVAPAFIKQAEAELDSKVARALAYIISGPRPRLCNCHTRLLCVRCLKIHVRSISTGHGCMDTVVSPIRKGGLGIVSGIRTRDAAFVGCQTLALGLLCQRL